MDDRTSSVFDAGLNHLRPVEFGYFLTPDARDPAGVLAKARLADELGYDLIGVQDHPYVPGHLDALAEAAEACRNHARRSTWRRRQRTLGLPVQSPCPTRSSPHR